MIDFEGSQFEREVICGAFPPITMRGRAPAAMRAVIAYCDGWMPTVRGEAFFAELGEFRELLLQSGREPKTLVIGAYDEPAGKLDQDHRALARFTKAGVGPAQVGSPGDSGQGIGEHRGVGEADRALGRIAQSENGESQRQPLPCLATSSRRLGRRTGNEASPLRAFPFAEQAQPESAESTRSKLLMNPGRFQ